MFGPSSELQVAGVHEKILCCTKYARCSRTKENVKVEGDGGKRGGNGGKLGRSLGPQVVCIAQM